MSRLMMAMLVTAGVGFAGTVAAQMNSPIASPMSEENYVQALKDAGAQYKIDRQACSSMSGNAKDICVADAKGKDGMAKADAEAAYRHTPKAREAARVSHADATYRVSLEKCDDLAGNPKDVCVKEAKAGLVKGKADAKLGRVVADTSREAAMQQAEARATAHADKRDADYKVAIEKCDALAGEAKETCVSGAKSHSSKL